MKASQEVKNSGLEIRLRTLDQPGAELMPDPPRCRPVRGDRRPPAYLRAGPAHKSLGSLRCGLNQHFRLRIEQTRLGHINSERHGLADRGCGIRLKTGDDFAAADA